MGKALYVGIDVGGTTVKPGVFTAEGELLGKSAVPTPPLLDETGFAAVTGGIDDLLASLSLTAVDVRGMGLAVPCPIPADGRVAVMANIKLDLLALAQALRAHYPDAAVTYNNDANAAAMGELWQGSAAGKASCVMVTLGTGVGGGVIIDGHVASGANGAAGEIGHMCVNPAEPLACGCGRHGCLEQYTSARGVVRLYREVCARRGVAGVEVKHDTDTLSVFEAYKAGDEAAREAVSTMCDKLGLGLSIVACTVDPDEFVIGGGVSGAFDLFADELTERYRHYALACSADAPISVSRLGNDAGIYGAAYLGLLAANE